MLGVWTCLCHASAVQIPLETNYLVPSSSFIVGVLVIVAAVALLVIWAVVKWVGSGPRTDGSPRLESAGSNRAGFEHRPLALHDVGVHIGGELGDRPGRKVRGRAPASSRRLTGPE